MKILVFGYDRTLIKSIKDSGFRSMSDVISYANNMVKIFHKLIEKHRGNLGFLMVL